MQQPDLTIRRVNGFFLTVCATFCLLLFSHSLYAAPPAESPRIIPNHYIVVFKDDVETDLVVNDMMSRHTMTIGFRYRHALNGMSVRMSDKVLEKLAADPRVAYIEPDVAVSISAQVTPTGVDRINADLDSTANIDGINDPMDIDIAILDTGIDLDHPDLNVVTWTYCHTRGPFSAVCDDGSSSANDINSHGTHVAGIAAAIDNVTGVVGVAPGARLWAVKVLEDDGGGSGSVIIAGVDYVIQHAAEIEVANLSLTGAGSFQALDDAIQNAINSGVVFTLAAGNSTTDVGNVFPAGHPNAITVSALADFDGQSGGLGSGSISFGAPANCTENVDDSLACFSNYGSGIDIMAPGLNIQSTIPGGGLGDKSGTSMASPHVAGAAALYLLQNPGASPASVKNALITGGDFTPCSNSVDGTCADDPDGIQEPLLMLQADSCDDADGDGICDDVDNCPSTANPGQEDIDGDSVGDACDNCVSTANTNQLDSDSDGIGDVCDNCLNTTNPDQLDTDSDGIGDVCDNCVSTSNTDQLDTDNDGVGDVCDNCVNTSNSDQLDTDGDGIGDVCDSCPTVDNNSVIDTDTDGLTDFEECLLGTDLLVIDTDIDGLSDYEEDRVYNTNPLLTDTDSDGLPDGDEVNTYGTDPLFTNQLGDIGPRGALDGVVNTADMIIMTRLLTGQITPTAGELLLGDLSDNAALDTGDLVLMQRIILNLIPAP